MRARAFVVVVALGTGLLGAACKKTVEGENKAWTQNLQHAQELSALYPGFSGAIAEQRKKAEDAMTAAKAVSDQEAQAKAMAEANSLLSDGFVGTLGQIEGKTRTLREKLATASVEAEHASDQAGARATTQDAQRILRNTDDALKAGATDAASATVVVRKIDADLSSATANLNRVIESTKKRKVEAAKATAGAPTGGAAPAANVPPPKVTWKCTFCGHVNDDSVQKCPGCGAPRSANKAPPAAKNKK